MPPDASFTGKALSAICGDGAGCGIICSMEKLATDIYTFADETRFQTCFGIIGSPAVAPQTDELLGTGAHSGNDCKVHR